MYFCLLLFFNFSNTGLVCPSLNLYEGQPCLDAWSGRIGCCLPLSACPSATADLKEKRSPIICSFKGREPVVCCRDRLPYETIASEAPYTWAPEDTADEDQIDPRILVAPELSSQDDVISSRISEKSITNVL